MSAFDLFTVRFLLASAGCLAAGLAVWGALLLCRRWLPALALQRTGWLLGQVVVALTFVLLLAPQARPMHALPVFEVDLSPDTAAAGSASPAPLGMANVHPGGAPGKAWLAHAALAWLAMYALVLSCYWCAWRKASARWRGWYAWAGVSRLPAPGRP